MDNQHRLIKGYRELTQREIDLISEGKTLAEEVGEFCKKLHHLRNQQDSQAVVIDDEWLWEGQRDLQKGFMAVIRSIAKPETF